jgi:homocysteine S-methyltransferase
VSRFIEAIEQGVVVADGGMGSMLHQIAEPGFPCTDIVNLTGPEAVLRVHTAFLRAGAQLIETNTFGANRTKLKRLGLEDKAAAINSRGVKLAREAREIAGVEAFVGGSIGPTGLRIHATAAQARRLTDVFREQAAALDDRGVDLFVLETFHNPWELARAIEGVRSVSGLPVIASLTLPAGDEWFDAEDLGQELDEEVEDLLRAIAVLDADVVGLNCTVGPAQILPALARLNQLAPERRLVVQPNSGLPRRLEGRFVYPNSAADYYGQFARDAVAHGARVVGGCCGVVPEQVASMAAAVADGIPEKQRRRPVIAAVPTPADDESPERPTSGLAQRFADGEFVVSMQVDPPKGTRAERILKSVRAFRDSGFVQAVDVNSNAMARLHMDALWMSALIENEGVETIAHYTPRDASMMGIEGNLLGAWKAGVRNVLAITGDPSVVNGEPGAVDVYQTDSIGLVRAIHDLNNGRDCFGNAIGEPPNFHIGVAVNPNATDLDVEIDRFKRKIDAGAQFAMTQVFFEWGCWERFLDRLGGTCPIPAMVAVWPLTSLRLALRIHHEVPGILVPDSVLGRLEAAGPHARAEGFAVARQLLSEAPDRAAGAYIIAPFKRPRAALELFETPGEAAAGR